MGNCFEAIDCQSSHTVTFTNERVQYSTDAESAGQLVVCTAGELELTGLDGEWVIPPEHMVYIPVGRKFQIRTMMPSSGQVVKFCKKEVAWEHNGCWVGQAHELASQLINYSLKWDVEGPRNNRHSKTFFMTLGEMVPGWFAHDRILWTPYTEDSSIQKAIDYAKQNGPGVSLPEVAVHVGMSERTLRRHMQKVLGQSWREFIREMRMNKAMELLRSGRKSVTETAFDVGFSSSSAFSSAFADYVGKTPSAFARLAKDRKSQLLAFT